MINRGKIPLKNSSCFQVIQQEALTRLPVEKGILTKEEFLEMVRVMDREMKREREGDLHEIIVG